MIRFKQKNKRGNSLIEISVLLIVMPILTLSFGELAVSSLQKFKEGQMYSVVLRSNATFLKALSGIRFGNEILLIDNTADRGTLRVSIGEGQDIEFVGDSNVDNLNGKDVSFINKDGKEIYLYDKELLNFERFKLTELSNTINRGGVKFDIKFGVAGANSDYAAMRFGLNSKYYLEYPITYTFRNSPE